MRTPGISGLVFVTVAVLSWSSRAATEQPVSYRTATVPTGTPITVALTSGVSSRTSAVEDAVNGRLQKAIVVAGVRVVPAGAAVSGRVTSATRSGSVSGRARLGIEFTSVRASDGRHSIRTTSIAREAPIARKKIAQTIAIGAALESSSAPCCAAAGRARLSGGSSERQVER